MPYKVTVERNTLRFAAAHFATFEDSCEPLHGHNYDVIVEVEGELTSTVAFQLVEPSRGSTEVFQVRGSLEGGQPPPKPLAARGNLRGGLLAADVEDLAGGGRPLLRQSFAHSFARRAPPGEP